MHSPQKVIDKTRPLTEAWKLKGRRTRSNRSDQEERRKAAVWRNERRRKQMIDQLIRGKRRTGPE